MDQGLRLGHRLTLVSAPAQTAAALEAHLREAGMPLDGVQLVAEESAGTAFLQAPLSYSFSAGGALLWLFAGVLLSAVASFLPARDASRLIVREVLAYE